MPPPMAAQKNSPHRASCGLRRRKVKITSSRIKKMIERLDDWVLENQGIMLILNILFISIAIVCTAINAGGILR